MFIDGVIQASSQQGKKSRMRIEVIPGAFVRVPKKTRDHATRRGRRTHTKNQRAMDALAQQAIPLDEARKPVEIQPAGKPNAVFLRDVLSSAMRA